MRPLHRVFVTGATGFVGRTVIQALRAEGYVVRCLVRRGSERDLRGVGAIERVEGDARGGHGRLRRGGPPRRHHPRARPDEHDVLPRARAGYGQRGRRGGVRRRPPLHPHERARRARGRPLALLPDQVGGRGGRARVLPPLDDRPPFRDLRARRRLRLAPGLGRAPPAGRAAHRRRPSPARARRAGGPGRGPRALPALGGEADLRGRRARQGHARGARRPDRQGPRAAADPEVQRAPSRRAGGDARPPPTALFPAHARPAPDARRGQRLRSGAVLLDVRVGAAAARDGPAPAARMTAHSSFSTSLRRDSGQPRDLVARVEAELRERIEEAVDFACLDALVERRRAHGLPAPVADSARDRDEFTQRVRTFLAELRDAVATDLTPEQRRKVDAAARAAGDETGRLLAVQVALAKELPDYWQRFEATRVAYVGAASASSGERPGLLRRLFSHG